MYLSATQLGRRCGLSPQEMNVLLNIKGFLSGEPGNWVPTEKAKKYIKEEYGDNGYGGFAQRSWEWLTWDETVYDELNITPEIIQFVKRKVSDDRKKSREENEKRSKEYWDNKNINNNMRNNELNNKTENNQDSNDHSRVNVAPYAIPILMSIIGLIVKKIYDYKHEGK